MLFRFALITALAAPAGAQADITGSWTVTSEPAGLNTCGEAATKSVYQWLISETGSSIDVQVVGKTAFPRMTGTESAGTYTLAGTSDEAHDVGSGNIFDAAVMVLKLRKPGVLQGTRTVLGLRRDGRPKTATTCMVVFDVTATK